MLRAWLNIWQEYWHLWHSNCCYFSIQPMLSTIHYYHCYLLRSHNWHRHSLHSFQSEPLLLLTPVWLRVCVCFFFFYCVHLKSFRRNDNFVGFPIIGCGSLLFLYSCVDRFEFSCEWISIWESSINSIDAIKFREYFENNRPKNYKLRVFLKVDYVQCLQKKKKKKQEKKRVRPIKSSAENKMKWYLMFQ